MMVIYHHVELILQSMLIFEYYFVISGTLLARRDSVPLHPVTIEVLMGLLLSMMSQIRLVWSRSICKMGFLSAYQL